MIFMNLILPQNHLEITQITTKLASDIVMCITRWSILFAPSLLSFGSCAEQLPCFIVTTGEITCSAQAPLRECFSMNTRRSPIGRGGDVTAPYPPEEVLLSIKKLKTFCEMVPMPNEWPLVLTMHKDLCSSGSYYSVLLLQQGSAR